MLDGHLQVGAVAAGQLDALAQLRHEPLAERHQQPVGVAGDRADDLAVVEDRLLDAVDRAAAHLGEDLLRGQAARLVVVGVEVQVASAQRPYRAPLQPARLAGLTHRAGLVLADVGEKRDLLLRGQRLDGAVVCALLVGVRAAELRVAATLVDLELDAAGDLAEPRGERGQDGSP